MNIIVCVKQVPNTNDVRINHETGTLIRDGVESIINPDDLNALEEALRIKDQHEDVKVIVLCMGPPQAKAALMEALAMGADKAILISDRKFAGSDTWATATVLASAVRKVGDFDIIMCGRQAIDGDTAQVGPELAEFLDLPQVTYVMDLKIKDDMVVATRAFESGSMVIEAKMPVLLSAIKELNHPRFMDLRRIYEAHDTDGMFEMWTTDDLDVDLTQIGVRNSPTKVFKTFVPTREFNGKKIQGPPKELAEKCFNEILHLNMI